MVRPSRVWIRSSRSSNRQPRRRLSARPTLVLPAPMKPTRKMARTGILRSDAVPPSSWREPGMPLMLVSRASFLRDALDVLAFLEVDFTTEGSQPYRGSRLVDGTCEGTPFFYQEGSVHLGLEPKIALDLPAHRLCLDVDRGVFGYGGI